MPPARRESEHLADAASTSRAYLDEARYELDWQWRRADAFERKAASLLSFDGVIIALLPAAVGPVRGVHNDAARYGGVALLIGAAGALLASALLAVWALRSREVKGPPAADVREHWAKHGRATPTTTPHDLMWRVADALLRDDGSVVKLGEDARCRGLWFERATYALAGGLFLLTSLVVLLATAGKGTT